MEIIEYSDKSIAVIGETKPYKEYLKDIGGRYVKNLTNKEDNSIMSGWVFPSKKTDKVVALINRLTIKTKNEENEPLDYSTLTKQEIKELIVEYENKIKDCIDEIVKLKMALQ